MCAAFSKLRFLFNFKTLFHYHYGKDTLICLQWAKILSLDIYYLIFVELKYSVNFYFKLTVNVIFKVAYKE